MSAARWGCVCVGPFGLQPPNRPGVSGPSVMLWEKGLVPFTEGRVLPSRSPRLPRREMLPVCVQS